MRMMLKMQMPAESANLAIKDGRFGRILSNVIDRIKPESVYFTTVAGDRGGFIVFDLQDPTDIPLICEPLFDELHAKIEIMPVMTAEDVKAGLAKAVPSLV